MKKKVVFMFLLLIIVLQFAIVISNAESTEVICCPHDIHETELSTIITAQVLCPHDIVTTRYLPQIVHQGWHLGTNEYDFIVICNTTQVEYPYEKFCEICLTTIGRGSTFGEKKHYSCVLRLY